MENAISPYTIDLNAQDGGIVFDKNIIINQKLAEGSFGKVYEGVMTIENKKVAIVMKINGDQEIHDQECKVLNLLNKKSCKNFPKLL